MVIRVFIDKFHLHGKIKKDLHKWGRKTGFLVMLYWFLSFLFFFSLGRVFVNVLGIEPGFAHDKVIYTSSSFLFLVEGGGLVVVLDKKE